jgi:hypothetical protein
MAPPDKDSLRCIRLPDVFGVDLASYFLGKSEKTIRSMVARGEIPGRRLGRSLVFERESFIAALRPDAPHALRLVTSDSEGGAL